MGIARRTCWCILVKIHVSICYEHSYAHGRRRRNWPENCIIGATCQRSGVSCWEHDPFSGKERPIHHSLRCRVDYNMHKRSVVKLIELVKQRMSVTVTFESRKRAESLAVMLIAAVCSFHQRAHIFHIFVHWITQFERSSSVSKRWLHAHLWKGISRTCPALVRKPALTSCHCAICYMVSAPKLGPLRNFWVCCCTGSREQWDTQQRLLDIVSRDPVFDKSSR